MAIYETTLNRRNKSDFGGRLYETLGLRTHTPAEWAILTR